MTITQKQLAEKKITLLNNKPNKTPHEQQQLEHYQQILNPKPLKKEQQAEIDRIEEEEKLAEKEQPTPKQLAEWKKKGVIGGFQGKNLDFSKLVDRTGWPKKLTINKCLNLKYLDVSDLGLETFFAVDCPNLEELNGANNNINCVRFRNVNKLETIYLNNNKLTYFDADILSPDVKKLDVSSNQLISLILEDCNNLEVLNCGINELTELDLNDCKKLKALLCYNNDFRDGLPKVNHLENLEYLACQNCGISELDVSGLKNLTELLCFGKRLLEKNNKRIILGLRKIDVERCEKLEVLDIGEGLLEELELIDLSNLEIVSVKQNSLTKIVANNCSKLDYLDFAEQGSWNLDDSIIRVFIVSNYPTATHINKCPDLDQLYHTKEAIFYNPEGSEITKEEFKTQFPKLRIFKCHEGENPAFDQKIDEREARKTKEKQQRARGNKPTDSGYQSETDKPKKKKNITSPDQLENTYPNLWEVYGQETDLTITGEHLTGTLFIENNPKIRTLNVGNNSLSYLVVRNCQQLHTLRYAYNKMDDHDAFIDWESCPNLRPENIDKYGYDGSVPWGDNEEFDQQDKEIDGKERFNKKLNAAKAAKNKREIQEKLKEQLLKILLELLDKAEKLADEGKWEQVKEKLAKIYGCKLVFTEKIKERIKQLEQRLLVVSQSTQSQSVVKIVISSIGISLLTIGLIFWFINKQMKKIKYIKN